MLPIQQLGIETRRPHRSKGSSEQNPRCHSDKVTKLWSLRSAGLTSRTKLKAQLNVTGQQPAVSAEWIGSLWGRRAALHVWGGPEYVFILSLYQLRYKENTDGLSWLFYLSLIQTANRSPRHGLSRQRRRLWNPTRGFPWEGRHHSH